MTDKKAEILAQLAQGAITATEAFTMLNQLNETCESPPPTAPEDAPRRNGEKPPNFDIPPPAYTAPDWVDDLIGGISGVVEDIKDMSIGTSLNEFFSGTYGHHENTLLFTSAPISQGILKLAVIGKNAKVTVQGYDGNVIRVRCKYNARHPGAQVLFHEEDGIYQVMYDESQMRSMEIACEVPYVMVKSAHFASKNGAVTVDGIQAETMALYTKNEKIAANNIHCGAFVAQNRSGQIRIKTMTARQIQVNTTNAKIQAEDVRAHNAELRTTNSGIKLAFVDVADLKLYTTNASLKLDKFLYDLPGDVDWDAERTLEAYTTNSSIVFAAPPEVGVKVYAYAKHSRVACKRQDMYFGELGKEHAQGVSEGFDFARKKLNVQMQTTNAPVKIRE